MVSNKFKVVIIGAGPAGIATAIQLKRYGHEPELLEKESAGGLLRNANLVENYPGFPNGVTGARLIRLMNKQMEGIGVQARYEEVIKLDWNQEKFLVETQVGKRQADIVVVASGTKSRDLPHIITPDARDRVFTEVWPLLKERGRYIVVVGAGDAAFDYALHLSEKRNFVTIFNRGKSARCLGLLWERASMDPSIGYRAGIRIRRLDLHGATGSLLIQCETEDSAEEVMADYIVFAIGRNPRLDFLSANLRHCQQDLVKAGRLYFVGDVQNGLFRQTAIAVGDGVRTAMQIHAALEKLG